MKIFTEVILKSELDDIYNRHADCNRSIHVVFDQADIASAPKDAIIPQFDPENQIVVVWELF